MRRILQEKVYLYGCVRRKCWKQENWNGMDGGVSLMAQKVQQCDSVAHGLPPNSELKVLNN